MPDVGVLNLQIRDDSAQAADGLDKLVGLLERMKGATSGIKLTPIATGINKIKEAISKIGQGEIDQLSQLADILNRIQGAAQGVNGIKISFGKAKQEADRIRESMEAARGGTSNGAGNGTELTGSFVNVSAGIQSARNEFAALYGEVEKFNGLVENTAWQFGDMGKKIAQVLAIWNQMRMAMSLPAGGNGGLLSGAITGEGSISDPNEIIPYASSLEQMRDGAVQAQEAAAEMAQSVQAANAETETLGESARGTKEQLEYEAEFLRRCAEMADKYKASEEANKEVNARFGRMMQPLSLEETDNMASYVTELTKMEAELEKASAAYNKFVNTLGAGDVKSINAALKLNKMREAIDKYIEAQERASVPKRSLGETNVTASQVTQYDQLITKLHEAREAYNALVNDPNATASKQMGGAMAIHKAEADINAYNALQEKLQTVDAATRQFAQEQLNAGVSAGTLTKQLFGLDGELKRKKGDLSAVSNETKSLRQRFSELIGGASGLGGAMKKMFPTLTGMLSRFKQLAKYRMLRAIITQITKGFKEGVENYYRYSEAIGGSFAPAMDSAASSLAQLKNSIGAAVAPALQSLIPVLNSVVNWVISGVNWLNQFFALLNGQKTWSRALPQTTKAFDSQTKAAKKAGAAVKDLLADWDELNIIQSETGGGGGTGSKKSTEDYKKMFEEAVGFDTRLKDVVDRIKNTFGDIWNLVGLIGAAILTWKISTAFDNMIGRIARLTAGVTISIIGVKFAYGAGVSAGEKGFFDTGDIVQTAGGALAAAFGGSLVSTALGFGGPVGFAIGLGIGLAATLYGYIKGSENQEDLLRWGSRSLTPEQINEYVQGQFNFDVESRINLFDSIIANEEEARRKLNEKIDAFSLALSKVTIGVDGTPEGITEAATAANDVITQINEQVKLSHKNIEVMTKIVPLTNGNGEDVTASLLDGLTIADKKLTDYFIEQGKEIASWIDKGQKTGWKENEAQMALDLMNHQQAIIDMANENRIHREFEVESEVNISSMTRDTASEVLQQEIDRVNEYREKVKKANEELAENYYWYADLADAAGLNDDAGNPLGDYYRNMADALKEEIKSGKIYEEIEPSIKKMKENWIQQLNKVYGSDEDTKRRMMDYGAHMASSVYVTPGLFSSISKEVKNGKNAQDVALAIDELLFGALKGIDTTEITRKAANAFGFSVLDILDLDAQKDLIDQIYAATGYNSSYAYDILMAMGISHDTIAKALKSSLTEGVEEGAEGAKSADEIIREKLMASLAAGQDQAAFDKVAEGLLGQFGKEAVDAVLLELDIPATELPWPIQIVPEMSNDEELKEELGDEADNASRKAADVLPEVGIPVGVHPEAYIEPGEENIDIDTGSGTGAGIGLPIDLQFDPDKSWIGNIAEQLGFELVNGQYVLKTYIKYITDDQPGNTPNLDEETRNPIPGGAQLWTVEKSGVTPGAAWTPGGANGGTMTVVAEVDNAEQESNVANGVTRGMTGVENLLDSIARTVVGILNKPVPTAGYPTANEGRRNAQAAREYGMVTGYNS